MFATIELQKQAAADRYYHQLHPKPWAKSPEEAAWALMQRIMGLGQWDGSSSPVQALSTKLPRDLPPVSPLGMDSGQYPNGVKGLDHVKGLDQWHGLMVARMSSSSAGGESATFPRMFRWRSYIPKNVFFLR